MSSVARAVGTASVRRVKRSLLPSRCFSTLILRLLSAGVLIKNQSNVSIRAALTLTPKAVERVKYLTQDCPVPCIGLKVSRSLLFSDRASDSGLKNYARLELSKEAAMA